MGDEITPRNKLRALIVEKFKTQEIFAARNGLQEARISKIVRGIIDPSDAERAAICEALSVDGSEIF